MKHIITVVCIAMIAMSASSQKLIDIYKKGTVRLIPDAEYATNNDWEKIFKTYNDSLNGRLIGNRKSLKIMPDGSVVVNHAYKNYFTKFSPTGVFEKEFGILNSKGIQLKRSSTIEGIINNNTFFSNLDNMGQMYCFDFNGKQSKILKLNYMVKQMLSLPNNKIAVVGWVIWEKKFRDFVSVVDYNTNSERVIWEHYTDRCDTKDHCTLFNYSYQIKGHGIISINTMPYSKETGISAPPQIECVSNKLIVSIPTTGEILVYDLEGNMKSKDKIEWAKSYISIEEQKEIQQKAIDKYKNIKEPNLSNSALSNERKAAILDILKRRKASMDSIVEQMESDLTKITEPIPLPIFSTIIKDSDGNLLYFEYPKENNANKFNVWIYESSGAFVCQSSFVCDDYELQINSAKMVFHNGYIYGLQNRKDTTGVPLRLVRFKLVNN